MWNLPATQSSMQLARAAWQGHPLIVATPALLTPGAEDWLALMPLLLRQMAGSAAPQQQALIVMQPSYTYCRKFP